MSRCHQHAGSLTLRVVLAGDKGSAVRWPSDKFAEELTVCAECGSLFVPPEQIEAVAARASERLLRVHQRDADPGKGSLEFHGVGGVFVGKIGGGT